MEYQNCPVRNAESSNLPFHDVVAILLCRYHHLDNMVNLRDQLAVANIKVYVPPLNLLIIEHRKQTVARSIPKEAIVLLDGT